MAEQCTMGVGCDEYGICYAEAHGQPEQCPLYVARSEQPDLPPELLERVFRAIHEHLCKRNVMQYLDNEEDCAGIARAVAPLLIAHGRELEKAWRNRPCPHPWHKNDDDGPCPKCGMKV